MSASSGASGFLFFNRKPTIQSKRLRAHTVFLSGSCLVVAPSSQLPVCQSQSLSVFQNFPREGFPCGEEHQEILFLYF